MKTARLVQHWLIPVALLSANTALIHFVYLISFQAIPVQSLYIFLCLMVLIIGILIKHKYMLIGASTLYWIILILVLAIY